MKRVFLDTNILIDYLACRKPFYDAARRIFVRCREKKIELYISALSFTTIYYVARKQYGSEKLLSLLKDLRLLAHVAATDDEIIKQALESEFADFEDAVQYYTAMAVHSDVIVSRNVKDYARADIPVISSETFCEQ